MKENTEIQIFADGEGLKQLQLLKVSPDLAVGDILSEIKSLGGAVEEDSVLFVGESMLSDRALSLAKGGVEHRSRVHSHRCHAIVVSVTYQGKEISEKFAPSTTVGEVRKWAIASNEFKIDPAMQVNLILLMRTGSKEEKLDVAIGTLTSSPVCMVEFDLVLDPRFQG